MKLTLTIECESLEIAKALNNDLRSRGFHSLWDIPCKVVVYCTPETVNYGDTMFEELETALAVATVFLREKVAK